MLRMEEFNSLTPVGLSQYDFAWKSLTKSYQKDFGNHEATKLLNRRRYYEYCSLGLSSYTNGQPECVRHEHPSRVDTVQMEHNYGKSREWLLAEKTWSSAVIASIAILSRPANISTKHFLETSKDIQLFVLPFSWPDVRRAGRNTKYAVSIIKKMVC